MEFFRELQGERDAEKLWRDLTIERLPEFCDQIDRVLSIDGDQGVVYCLWGQFDVRRERIRGGVRFSLPGCPNALAWTLTTGLDPRPAATVVHCTINRREHDPDFIESIEMFCDGFAEGLSACRGG